MRLALFSVLLLLAFGPAEAAERKALKDVNTDAFINDTQRMLSGNDSQHVSLVWWIPQEYWASVTAKNKAISVAQSQNILDALSGISLLAVVQADISAFGSFDFYSKAEVKEDLFIEFAPEDGQAEALQPVEDVEGEVKNMLSVLKPVLANAVGNLGSNMHFFVLTDETRNDDRLADPYAGGLWNFRLQKRDGTQLSTRIETPLNALFIPRKCPNGKDAHISWKYCPWSGERLPE